MVKINNSWDEILKDVFYGENYLRIREFLKYEYSHYRIFPKAEDIFNAFKYTPYENVKVVIIGQDPYHEVGQAHGLAFSVLDGVSFPPSLRNIFIEIKNELGIEIPKNGNLTKWAKEGVLLLNTTLTVREGIANSHANHGWENFTDEVIKKLVERDDMIIFVLWGNYAKKKKNLITSTKHCVLEASHPSPLSAYNGFFGCGHFKKINDILVKNKKTPIDWSLD